MDATALTLTQIAALPPDEAWHAIDVLAEAAFDALPQMERQSHDICDGCGGYRAALTLAVASLRDVRAQVAAEIRAAADAGVLVVAGAHLLSGPPGELDFEVPVGTTG